MLKIRKPKKGKDTDLNFLGDGLNKDLSEDSSSEEEDLNYIEMVRVALRETRA